MEFMEIVSTRRSIRKYEPGCVIPREELEQMIQCAKEAPSWKNSQTARYYVVTDPECLQKLRETALPQMNSNNSENAGAIIVTCFEKNRAGFNREGVADNELGNEWGAYDLGLSNMLLCLKATEMGYGTLIMGIRDHVVLRELLGIADSQEVVAVIAVGKPAISPEKPPRKELDHVAKFI